MTNQQTIVSEIEIGYKNGIPMGERIKVTNSKIVVDTLKNVYPAHKLEHKEMFYATYLNAASEILHTMLICEGGINSCLVDARLVFQGALKTNAVGIILSHNHPSGNMKASQQDINITNNIKKGCEILNFQLLDHVILCSGNNYFSFADEGLM